MTDPLRHPLLARTFFPPRPAPALDPVCAVAVPGARLSCWRKAGKPMVLLFHGEGDSVAEARRDIGVELEALRVGMFLAEQRGIGGSTGRQTFPALLDDAEALLAATQVAPRHVIVFGRSIGSLAAIELASRHALGGLILESGIADVGEYISSQVAPLDIGMTPAMLDVAVRERYDHQQKLARYHGPILVLASGTDERIDRTHAARLASWAAGDEKDLVMFARGSHAGVFLENRVAYVAELRRFLAAARVRPSGRDALGDAV